MVITMAWLQATPRAQAEGELAEAYEALVNRPLPQPYRLPGDEAPGIVRAHSLDPQLMRLTFGSTGKLHASTLSWAEREVLASVTARNNQCFY